MDFAPAIEKFRKRAAELETELGNPAVYANQRHASELAREHIRIKKLLADYETWLAVQKQMKDTEELIATGVAEMADLAKGELEDLKRKFDRVTRDVQTGIAPPDPNDSRNTIIEIRAGTGGEEAALFAADLFRMYSKFADLQGWKVEIMDTSPSERGGFKEIVFSVLGQDVYKKMRYESGVHRVQRVPATEAQGRIHTSAATVAVLPEAEDVDVKIEDKDLKIDVFRSSGPGGQSVNTTDSAVRVTHLPTGVVVQCQDQKSQLQNKLRALEVLRARLLDRMIAEREAARSTERRAMVGNGDRSAKIRTYNFPQGRVTDHRINYSIHNLPSVLDGHLEPVIERLRSAYREERVNES